MNLQRILGLGLIVAAALLLYFGMQSTESWGEKLAEQITGRYSDETMAYLIGGAVAGVVGLGLLLFGKRR